jgi:hypothetical protein
MKLSLGNMTLELNVFNVCKQQWDDDDIHEVDMIESIVEDEFLSTLFSDPLEVCLAHYVDFNDEMILDSECLEGF